MNKETNTRNMMDMLMSSDNLCPISSRVRIIKTDFVCWSMLWVTWPPRWLLFIPVDLALTVIAFLVKTNTNHSYTSFLLVYLGIPLPSFLKDSSFDRTLDCVFPSPYFDLDSTDSTASDKSKPILLFIAYIVYKLLQFLLATLNTLSFHSSATPWLDDDNSLVFLIWR